MLRSIIRPLSLVLLISPLAVATADAQGRGTAGIPPGHLPKAGQCRVWYEGVPPGRQPAATSCREAERIAARTRGARVIYGGDHRYEDRRDGRWDNRRDRRHDGRWEDRRRLPVMPRVSELRNGRIPGYVQRQVRGTAVRARWEDRNRNGRPERVVFYDRRGRALETWYDLRDDGRVDRVVRH